MTTTKEGREQDTPANRVLTEIEFRLRCSRDKMELQILKAVLLRAGIISLSNSKDNTFVIRENKK